jgi:hypothetical protein
MRRITVELRIALQTTNPVPLDDLAGALVDDLVMFQPQVSVPFEGLPAAEWPVADVTAVALSRVSEQEQEQGGETP